MCDVCVISAICYFVMESLEFERCVMCLNNCELSDLLYSFNRGGAACSQSSAIFQSLTRTGLLASRAAASQLFILGR